LSNFAVSRLFVICYNRIMPLRVTSLLLAFALLVSVPLAAQKTASAPEPLAKRISGMVHHDGLLPLDWDANAGKLYMEIPLSEAKGTRSQEYLFVDSLPYGTGSNDLGLDRGQLGRSRIVYFERVGPKLLLVEPNEDFRTSSTDPAERLAVTQSFPVSVLAGFTIDAESATGTVLVDATEYFLSDVHLVASTLAEAKQGAYKLDMTRSTIDLDDTKAFPKNTEVEAILTFVTEDTAHANFVRDVTPDAHALTIRERHSFIELPGPGYTPRRFSPRAGYFPSGYRDMNVPLGESLDQRFIIRHRLIKRDPTCTQACVPVAPIQYYVDSGAPEPIRTALLEGARWWDQAFQAAGWAPHTFRVDILPPGADPMDIRYNIIQWVHRYDRGWSYGDAITDPRTGEIIKGNVTLGSLRGRQDYLIAEALLAPYADGHAPADAAKDAALQMVLARLRQLAAHETGHTLGLAHNFAASSFPHSPDEAVSVMDYPHPYIELGPGNVPSLAHAYPSGIGIWDKVAIDYGYREFDSSTGPAENAKALDEILSNAEKSGLVYITDEDARPLGSAHPHAHLWDNGTDPADELNRLLTVRSAALARFGINCIRMGTPTAQLEETLVPLYLLHRYQTEAAIKEIGGLDYRYTVRGDGQMGPKLVAPAEQRKALNAVLKTLAVPTLTLPESLISQLPPHPPGLPRTPESFAAHTGLTFDPVAAAETAADLTLSVLFNSQRASRLVEYHARDAHEPSLDEVIGAVLDETSSATKSSRTSGLNLAIARAVEARAVEALLALAANPQASFEARAITATRLRALKGTLPNDAAGAALAARIAQFETTPDKFVPAKPIPAPPGMPIGEEE
jgi:Met-zincin/Domain of unknown function (DUF5117)